MKTHPRLQKRLDRERTELLTQLEDWLEGPLIVLGFVWLGLLVLEFTGVQSGVIDFLTNVIWVIFGIDFAVKFALAPDKLLYLKTNWLTAIALVLPALRIFRIARFVRLLRASRAVRGLRLMRLVTSLNRGFRALGATLGRRGFGYVVALTVLVTFAGAAGMLAFERDNGGFANYWEALWWTAMLMTTLGSEAWPQTAEGRILTFLLALYAFTVFGYVTATLATFFIGRDAENAEAELPSARDVALLREEIRLLRQEIRP